MREASLYAILRNTRYSQSLHATLCRLAIVVPICLMLSCERRAPTGSSSNALPSTPLQSGQPSTTLAAKPEHDFGVVNPGDVLSHTFTFINTTTKPCRISGIAASCACMIPSYTTQSVAPNQKLSIVVEMRVPEGVRDLDKYVDVEFHENAMPPCRFYLTGTVRSFLSVSPDDVSIVVESGKQHSLQLTVGNYSDEDFEELLVEGLPSWATTCLTKVETPQDAHARGAPRQAWKLQLTADTNQLEDTNNKFLLTVSDSRGKYMESIPVSLRVSKPFTVIPDRVWLPGCRKGSRAPFRLVVRILDPLKSPENHFPAIALGNGTYADLLTLGGSWTSSSSNLMLFAGELSIPDDCDFKRWEGVLDLSGIAGHGRASVPIQVDFAD